jgi:hypothetical protein
MMKACWRTAPAAVFFAAAIFSSPLVAETSDRESVVMVGNVSYVSGGIGEDSRERLQSFTKAFNLKLVLAQKAGAYIGDVQVLIAGRDGKPLVQAFAEGPIFMAKLPPGSYDVTTTADGQSQRQKVVVNKGGLSTLHFRWP